ncbi:hypothetical protein BX666DRAFT_1528772 [Dichotomocladium elegans]|nr:hypothetical protein BX666DRAFT_1528772 [Dichotomocladium elegans]
MVRDSLDIGLHGRVLELAADQTLSGVNSVLRVDNGLIANREQKQKRPISLACVYSYLTLRGLANQHFAILGKSNDGGSGACTLSVFNDTRVLAFHH